MIFSIVRRIFKDPFVKNHSLKKSTICLQSPLIWEEKKKRTTHLNPEKVALIFFCKALIFLQLVSRGLFFHGWKQTKPTQETPFVHKARKNHRWSPEDARDALTPKPGHRGAAA